MGRPLYPAEENKSGNINTGKILGQRYNFRRFIDWQRGIARTCGRNSVVECQLPKLDVEGSNPFARFVNAFSISNTTFCSYTPLGDFEAEFSLPDLKFMPLVDGTEASDAAVSV